MTKFHIFVLAGLIVLFTPQAIKAEVTQPNQGAVLPLRVMTFNIHGGINWSGVFDLNSLADFIRENDPDIVGLQEVDLAWSSMSGFHNIPGELAERLHMYYAFAASRERNNGYFGNLILSKYPILQQWTCLLPGNLEQRSLAFIQIMVGGAKINFLTTHLGLSESDRLQQVAAINEFVNQVTGPIIISGDFNGSDNDLAVRELKHNLSDLQEISDYRDCGTFRSKDGKLNPTSKMDYILVTPELSFSKFQVVDNYISDHVPLIAELTLQLSVDE
jgi:endonuclease/exonuclease/phosphatase family metal-dependent hydrolase